PTAKAKPAVKTPKAPSTKEPAATPPTLSRPMVAIIIDDMGHALAPAQRLAELGMPLTLSVLPHSSQAKAVARFAHAKGLEVMLHLPMEPKGYPGHNPGQGVLLCDMTRERLLEVLRDDLSRVPLAAGVNNHMGSSFSLHPELLEPVLLELKRRGLFYLDSFTSADSQGLATAQRLGLRTGRREVFLDHQAGREAIDGQMRRLLELAKERGRAVAIGHPRPDTIKALGEWAPRLRRQVTLVTVSELLDASSDPNQGH
ncbi:MAG: divergent polysaccharide deacetylase family protein, partial [Desulfarculaceae bacterium]|nr:divergent polysaccharide deacetylase family protein [Desulfarculaceae bacterium]